MQILSVTGGAPLYGTVPIHGAKNSVLPILAAAVLCRSPCVLHNCPQIEDVDTALEILKCLGCRSERRGGSLFVDASGMDGCEIPVELAGKMRSSIVFLGPVLARRGKARLALPGGCPLGARPIDLHLMELEQFSRYTLEKEILTRMCGRLTPEQEAGYRQLIEAYRVLEASPEEPDREMRLLELDNAFHRRAFELCGMEHHFDHMLASLQHVERIRKFSLQTNENKAVCAAHTRILDAMVQNDTQELSRALESHLSRYKQTVEEVQRLHPDYFTDGLEP